MNSHTYLTETGHLQVDFRPYLDTVLRFGPWQDGLPVESCDADGWRLKDHDPNIPLFSGPLQASLLDESIVQRFSQTIPDDVVEQVRRFSYMQTTLLQWTARYPAARDLLASHPLLLWLMAAKAQADGWPPERIAFLLRIKRPQIVQAVYGINQPGVVRLLSKIRLLRGDWQELALIRDFLLHPQSHAILKHFPILSVAILYLLRRFPDLSASRLLNKLAGRDYGYLQEAVVELRQSLRLREDVLRLGQVLEISDAAKALDRCDSLEDIQHLHDRWTDRANQKRTLFRGWSAFPAPPLPGNNAIVPILTLEDLQEEGRLMRHCIGSYATDVMNGKCYIYRVMQPQRATLQLSIRGGAPLVGALKLAHNREPDAATWKAVYAWLEQSPQPYQGMTQDDFHRPVRAEEMAMRELTPPPETLNLFEVEDEKVVFEVIGIGHAGRNAVDRMRAADLLDIESPVVDIRSLEYSTMIGPPIHPDLNRRQGAGGNPAIGRQIALAHKERIADRLRDATMVILIAGMGRGTGGGAAPVIAEIAHELGVYMTVAAVTTPFPFEGEERMAVAEKSIETLCDSADSVLVIPSEALLDLCPAPFDPTTTFDYANEMLLKAVRGMTDIIVHPSLIGMDISDVHTVLSMRGRAAIGIGAASGKNRAERAAAAALACPLLRNFDLARARGHLLTVHAGSDIQLEEVSKADRIFADVIHPNSRVVVGLNFDPNMEGQLQVTLISTGFEPARANT